LNLKEKSMFYLDDLAKRYVSLEKCRYDITRAAILLTETAKNNGLILVAGNGGSAADADHIVGELMKGFVLTRRLSITDKENFKAAGEYGKTLAENLQYGIKAICLSGHSALSTATLNDNGADMSFAQAAYNYASENDTLIALSTSGNAKNLCLACEAAKMKGAKTIAVTGENGGEMKYICDITIKVPETETYKTQELHLPVYHTLCLIVEHEIFA